MNKVPEAAAENFSDGYPPYNAWKFTEFALCDRSENVFADTPQDGIL